MGCWFMPVNLVKEEYLDPRKFMDGPKLSEFGSGGLTLVGLALLLAEGYGAEPPYGHWSGDRIVIAGNEVDDDGPLYLSEEQMERFNRPGEERMTPNVYSFARQCCRDISEEVIVACCEFPSFREDYEAGLVNGGDRMLGEEGVRRLQHRILEKYGPRGGQKGCSV